MAQSHGAILATIAAHYHLARQGGDITVAKALLTLAEDIWDNDICNKENDYTPDELDIPDELVLLGLARLVPAAQADPANASWYDDDEKLPIYRGDKGF